MIMARGLSSVGDVLIVTSFRVMMRLSELKRFVKGSHRVIGKNLFLQLRRVSIVA